MENITYLLGAGASAHCLPIVNDMEGRIGDFIRTIQSHRSSLGNEKTEDKSNVKYVDLHKEVIALLNRIRKICHDHASVDTYAKKLFIRSDYTALDELKFGLSLFFILQQRLRTYDKRYDYFFAAILDTPPGFLPNNINIVSWNYDHQVEIAYSEYAQTSILSKLQFKLNYYDINRMFSQLSVNNNRFFTFIKLNGTAGLAIPEHHKRILEYDYSEEFLELYKLLLRQFNNFLINKDGSFIPQLRFAWENDINDQYFRNIKEICSMTDILVVIGYSFPFFNRKIDKFLLEAMGNIKTIVIQDTNVPRVIDSMLSLRPDLDQKIIKEISHLDNQFYIPYQY